MRPVKPPRRFRVDVQPSDGELRGSRSGPGASRFGGVMRRPPAAGTTAKGVETVLGTRQAHTGPAGRGTWRGRPAAGGQRRGRGPADETDEAVGTGTADADPPTLRRDRGQRHQRPGHLLRRGGEERQHGCAPVRLRGAGCHHKGRCGSPKDGLRPGGGEALSRAATRVASTSTAAPG